MAIIIILKEVPSVNDEVSREGSANERHNQRPAVDNLSKVIALRSKSHHYLNYILSFRIFF